MVIAAAAFYLAMGKGTEQPAAQQEVPADSQKTISAPQPDTQTPGRYEEYSPEAVAAASSKQRLLFFHASWCPQCRELDASIRATSLPAGVVIFKVDYDTCQDLRQKYGVALQTTVVSIDENANKIKSFVAYNEPTWVSVQRELLP